MTEHSTRNHVAILLCTCNGARFLQDQLESYLAQTHQNWSLWVSDDGSDDATCDIIRAFATAQRGRHEVHLLDGPRKGAAHNFMSLLCHPDLPLSVVAISDQDDVWLPHKLSAALTHLSEAGALALEARPAIYGAQSIYVDADMTPIGRSHMPPRTPCFENALLQNVISGHSTVLNAPGLAMVRKAGVLPGIAFHDWWLYQFLTAIAGQVILDDTPVLKYRQHGDNVLGAHRGVRAQLARAGMVLGRRYGDWIGANLNALSALEPLLSPSARALVRRLRTRKHRWGPGNVALLRRSGVHRQTRLATLYVYIAAFMGRL